MTKDDKLRSLNSLGDGIGKTALVTHHILCLDSPVLLHQLGDKFTSLPGQILPIAGAVGRSRRSGGTKC
ncbi:MAG: hypothetical protein IGR92_16885 [Leptolyngbyaceae cyanobacterium T60_A2020_046]|nr:hypothetical protein [Leptolyngbyaceae cyanobacterium T60_A2020_046]